MRCKIKVVFDLDNVIRDLDKTIEKKFNVKINDWYWDIDGKDIYDLVATDFSILTDAPTTKYYKTIKRLFPRPTIWSHQPSDWQKSALEWLGRHFDNYDIEFFSPHLKAKALKEDQSIYLVDDYQGFSNYERIILIDKLYNQYVNAPLRVKKATELKYLLKGMGAV